MKVSVGDYVIIIDDKNKKHFVQVLEKSSDHTYSGEEDNKTRAHDISKIAISFTGQNVIANLGRFPFNGGSVYGINIEPFKKFKTVTPFSAVYFFTDLLGSEEKALLKVLGKIASSFHEKGWFPSKEVNVEIRDNKGKFAGIYKHSDKEEVPDVIILRPKNYLDDLEYICYHELAHGIWFCHLSDEYKDKWIAQYAKSTVLNDITKDDLNSYLSDLLERGSCKDYANDLEEETLLVFKEILKFIQVKHRITRTEIDLLLERQNHDLITKIWPVKPLQIGKKDLLVSEYAAKNVYETFAEAVAFYLTKKDLPINVQKLVKFSLKSIS